MYVRNKIDFKIINSKDQMTKIERVKATININNSKNKFNNEEIEKILKILDINVYFNYCNLRHIF